MLGVRLGDERGIGCKESFDLIRVRSTLARLGNLRLERRNLALELLDKELLLRPRPGHTLVLLLLFLGSRIPVRLERSNLALELLDEKLLLRTSL